MRAIVGHLCHAVLFTALVLIMLGDLGRSMPVHAGLTGDAINQSAAPAPTLMDAMSDTGKAICELQRLSLAVALPVSPAVTRLLPRARMAETAVVLLPAPHLSGPDKPPPKHLIL